MSNESAPMSDEVREQDHEPEELSPAVPSDPVAAALCAKFPSAVFNDSLGQAVCYVDRAHLGDIATFLRDEQQFTMCLDVCAVDHSADAVRVIPVGVTGERFELVTSYLSHARNRRIRIIAQIPESDPSAPSVTPMYPGANFAERETFDLFGITFDGHPELTRILMPDEWEGHPLRKDFAPAEVPVTFKGDPSPR